MTAIEEHARSIFLTALDRAPEQWPAFLDEACGGNAELRARVDQLLHAHQAIGSIHGGGAGAPVPTVDEPSVAERPGTVIGPYKLLEQIGEGGFGVVFMAEQTHPVRRKVALKVLKPGMDTRQVVARFEAERQALAIMDHPNIAKVFDGGATASGRPFFVMELVKGMPITEFCDQNHLTPRQRLELFVPVCQAVQHAHQKGIIHRDLKPSNVLVTPPPNPPPPVGGGQGGGVVKVIDFGVAKALGQELTDKTLFTGFAQMIGTPLYMSPEQAGQSGLDIDTRTDIYALGVLLYELLTGTTPFEKERFKKAGYDEIRRIIRDEEPPKPSTRLSELNLSPGPSPHRGGERGGVTTSLASVAAQRHTEPAKLTRLVRGELDWIVMKALEKDRNRRYETANGFAMDVQRYLADEPVTAGPPSATYRLKKFLRRNRRPVLAATLMFLALVGGMIGTTWGMIRATKAEGVAVAESGEKDKAITARDRAMDNLGQEQRQTRVTFTNFLLDRGLALCEEGDVGLGVLWLGRALENAPADAADLQRVIRMNLAAWHRETCSLKAVLERRMAGRAAYSADGTKIMLVDGFFVTFPTDPEVRILDSATGQDLAAPFRLPGRCGAFRALADGNFLLPVIGGQGENTVEIWEATSRKPIGPALVHPDKVDDATISADGRVVLTISQKEKLVRLWDATNGKRIGKSIESPRHGLLSAALGDDATRLVTFSPTVQIWDAATGEPAGPPLLDPLDPGLRPGRGAILSPDGKTLAAVYTRTRENAPANRPFESLAQLWDVASGKPLGAPIGLESDHLVFSPDGSSFGTYDRNYGQSGALQLWHIRKQVKESNTISTLTQGNRLTHPTGVKALIFGPRGLMLTTHDDSTVRLRLGGLPIALPHPKGEWTGAAFHPNGRSFLTTSGRAVRLWEVPSGRFPASVGQSSYKGFSISFERNPICKSGGSKLECLAFGADGRTVLTAVGDTGGVPQKLFFQQQDLATEKFIGSAPEVRETRAAAFSADGTKAMTLAWELRANLTVAESTVQFWETGAWNAVGPPLKHAGCIWSAVLSSDARLVLVDDRVGTLYARASKRTSRLYDANTWQPLGPWWPAPNDSYSAALSPDGKIVLTLSSTYQGQLRDAITGAPLGAPLEHQGDIVVAAFSPDGRTLITGSEDQTARLWNVADGRLIGSPLRHPTTVTAVAFSPDGRMVLTGTKDETARFWDVATAKPIGPGFRRVGGGTSVAGSEPSLHCLAFHPDGRQVLTGTRDGDLRRWEAPHPPLEESVERLVLWTKTISDRELDASGVAGWQTPQNWNQHRQRLHELGGPPVGTVLTSK